MSNFIKRTTAPTSGMEYYGNKNPFTGGKYDMFKRHPLLLGNCTHYCYSRMSEIIGKKSNLPGSSAHLWIRDAKNYVKGTTPKLGAVIVWKHRGKNKGHVGIIEEIKSNGDLVVSMSGWNSFLFKTRTVTKSSGYVYSDYELLGFIYCPIEFKQEVERPVIRQSNSKNYKAEVKEIQSILRAKGYVNVKNGKLTNTLISADGIWGNNTEQAIRRFQKNSKIASDGIVGKNTWAALYK